MELQVPLQAPKTVYQLNEIVKKALEECREAKLIRPDFEGGIVISPDAAEHISKSVIGELHELEIIRRLAPIFREIPRLVKDFEHIDTEQTADSHRAALKIQEG